MCGRLNDNDLLDTFEGEGLQGLLDLNNIYDDEIPQTPLGDKLRAARKEAAALFEDLDAKSTDRIENEDATEDDEPESDCC